MYFSTHASERFCVESCCRAAISKGEAAGLSEDLEEARRVLAEEEAGRRGPVVRLSSLRRDPAQAKQAARKALLDAEAGDSIPHLQAVARFA